MEVSLRCAMVLSDGDWIYLFSSSIAIDLWVAAIVGVNAPLFLRLFLSVSVTKIKNTITHHLLTALQVQTRLSGKILNFRETNLLCKMVA